MHKYSDYSGLGENYDRKRNSKWKEEAGFNRAEVVQGYLRMDIKCSYCFIGCEWRGPFFLRSS